MEASRVMISETAWRLGKLNQNRKRELREQAILDVIRNTPAGMPIKMERFVAAARLKTSQNGWQFVNRMAEEGKIVKVSKHGINGAIYCLKEATEKKPVAENNDRAEMVALTTFKAPDSRAKIVEQAAKDFLWNEQSQANDVHVLRRFVEFLREEK